MQLIDFNDNQIEKLSDIFSDIGLVILASVVIPSILDRIDLKVLLFGIIGVLSVWIISLKLRK